MPECHATSSTHRFYGRFFFGAVYSKVGPRYVEKFCDGGMNQKFAEAVPAGYKVDGTT